MIHLANDPNASRMGYRPDQNESKGRSLDHPRSRGGHAWPFFSRHSNHPAPQVASKNSGGESGS